MLKQRSKAQGILFASLLLLGAEQGLFAAGHQKPNESPGQGKPVPEEKARRKRPVKAPPLFVPTEEVSAGKAVSFPTDI